jgi:hypothetical protein
LAGRLEESTGLAFRFVIGRTNDKSKMAELKREIAEYDDFLLLDIEEQYSQLPYKTLVLMMSCMVFLPFFHQVNYWIIVLSWVFFFFFCRLAFFKAAYALFDSEFYVKADDDIYLRPGG